MSADSQDIPVAYQDTPSHGAYDAAVAVSSPAVRRAITLRKRRGRNRYYLLQLMATSLPMVVVDLLSLFASATAVLLVAAPFLSSTFGLVQLCATLAPMLLASYCYCGLYPGVAMSPILEFRQLAIGSTVALFVLLAARFAVSFAWLDVLLLSLMWITLIALAPILRSIARSTLASRSWWGQPAIIVGRAPHGTAMYGKLREQASLGLRPVGVVDELHRQWDDEYSNAHYLGPISELGTLCQQHRAFWLIAVSDEAADLVLEGIDRFAPHVPNVVVTPIATDLPSLWSRSREYAGRVGVHFRDHLRSPLHLLIKRLMDVTIVLIGGALVLPLFILIGLSIKFASPGPVFYTATRIGRNGRRFRAWKFRTMVRNADELLESYLKQHPELRHEWGNNHKLKHDLRIIKGVGWFLRKSSLDELPQLWNVLRGDMSLIGPRPIVDEEIEKYGDAYKLYCRVVPGMSGLWQVSGRNHTTYDRRVELDSYYVRNWSPWLDLYILVRTIRTVLLCEGAY